MKVIDRIKRLLPRVMGRDEVDLRDAVGGPEYDRLKREQRKAV